MREPNMLNMVEILKRELERQVKEAVTEEIVKSHLDKFEAEIRGKIKPLVESVCFKGISGFKNAMHMRDELSIYIRINDDEGTQKVID